MLDLLEKIVKIAEEEKAKTGQQNDLDQLQTVVQEKDVELKKKKNNQ